MPALSRQGYGNLNDPTEAKACAFEPRIAADRKQSGAATTARKITAQAIAEGKQIYDTYNKKWFSPDEFVKLYGHYCADNEYFGKIELRDVE